MTAFQGNLVMEEFKKLMHICQSYDEISYVLFFEIDGVLLNCIKTSCIICES